jgi:type IV pilus assembly protein PilY1
MKISILLTALLVIAGTAWSQAVITLPSGNVSLGIGQYGQLGNCGGNGCNSGPVVGPGLPANSNITAPYVGDTGDLAGEGYGIYLKSQNADSVTPGCFCEGWGAAYNGTVQGNASNDNGGNSGIGASTFASTATTATSVVSIGNLQVTQAYAPAPGAGGNWLFQDTVTLTNTGSTTDTNVEYARSTDWDINPTEFHETETLGGWGATQLIYSVNNGFCNDDPLTLASSCGAIATTTGSAWTNTNFTQNGVADQGSSFLFNFGSLAAGKSVTFDVFYGAADNSADALGALGAVGAQVYVLGYASDGAGCVSYGSTCVNGAANLNSGTWMFAFAGVGGTPIGGVPEPGSVVLFGSVLLGLGALRARHRRTN